jgi:hypothetical protein
LNQRANGLGIVLPRQAVRHTVSNISGRVIGKHYQSLHSKRGMPLPAGYCGCLQYRRIRVVET